MQKQRAFVTGATSGIGQAIALALHAAGMDVMATGRNAAALDGLAARGLRTRALDLGDVAALPAALQAALADFAPDVLVNNAGMVAPPGNFCDMAEGDIHRSIATNLTQALLVTHAIAPGMRARGSGHIFFTGSIAGHTPYPNMAVYAATKAALGGFAQSLRLDLSSAGVRVTEIVAGRVESPLYKDVLSPVARAAMYANQGAAQPADVAAMVLAVLALPAHANVGRFDILPTRQPVTAQVPAAGKAD
ncbi:MAG: SDR family oxidoreductase [Rhodobacteraceae bacterium]|jgi:NADP-dependent 3-hydroxy acid dehydrogenase YdfG|nr:SDR family oxidoreductase [Paracoccaceae bacterium]